MPHARRILELSCALSLVAAASAAFAADGAIPDRGALRTEVRVEGCLYGPQPEIVNGPRGRALHARWQRDLCAHRDRRERAPGWIVPRIEFDPASDALLSETPSPDAD